MRTWLVMVLVALGASFLMGCSTSGPSAPEIADVAPGFSAQASVSNGHAILWGFWEVRINPVAETVEIIPLRGAQWTVNVVKFLQPPAGKPDGVSVEIVDASEWLSQGHLGVDVTLTHPFPGLPQYTGADARGVFITPAQHTFNHDPALRCTDMGPNAPYLANADGYTRWMNPVEFMTDGTLWTYTPGALGMGSGFDATLNAYKYFANWLGPTDDLYEFFSNPEHLHNRGQFLSGTKNTRRYELYFPLGAAGDPPELVYQYAVLASWMQPEDLDPGDLPGSFPPDGNTRESFTLSVADNSTLYCTPDESGGDINLQLEIFNWRPYLGAVSSVMDEIARVVVESPQGILPQPYVEFDNAALAPTAVDGTTGASSVVSIEIENCTPTALDDQMILIAIEQADQSYDNYGYGSVYPDAPLTAYFFHELKVSDEVPQEGPVVESIDPDHGIVDTHLYDIVVAGQNLGGVTELTLVGDADEASAVNLQVVDDQHLACELVLDGLPIGLYDVVAHDPVEGDGVLVDGFEIMECPCGIHSTTTVVETSPDYNSYYTAALFTSGPHAGQLLAQDGSPDWIRMDVQNPPEDPTPILSYALKPDLYSGSDIAWSLDTDPVNGVFAFASYDDPAPTMPNDHVHVCDQTDGSYIGSIDTDAAETVCQLDFDEHGNLWIVCGEAWWPNSDYNVQRWDYDPQAAAPHYTFVDEWSIDAQASGDTSIGDIIVLQRYRKMFVACNDNAYPFGVEVHCWDISSGTPVYEDYIHFEEYDINYNTSNLECHLRLVDVKTDRSDDVLAGCRLLAMFQGWPSSNRSLEVRKFDVNLNQLAEASIEYTYPCDPSYPGEFSNFVIDDNLGGRILATYHPLTACPSPSRLLTTDVPGDW